MIKGERRRRWPLVLGIVVVVLAAVGGGGYLYLANWRPDLGPGERYGVDVSHHQGTVDWEAVAADGISFAYVKATEGRDWVDRRFAANWAGAGAAGLDRGAYHFFSLCSPAGAQAEHFLDTVPPDPGALPPALDLEFGGNCGARPDEDTVRREVGTFLTTVEEAWGRPMILYVLDDWNDVYPVEQLRQRWYRQLIFRPDHDWHLWQLHNFATVDGVGTRVDLNVMRP